MAYYDQDPPGCRKEEEYFIWRDLEDNRYIQEEKKWFKAYEYKVRHINSYWCPTKEYMEYVLKKMKKVGGKLVTMCGDLDSGYCKDCRNCETYYWQTIKHLKEKGK